MTQNLKFINEKVILNFFRFKYKISNVENLSFERNSCSLIRKIIKKDPDLKEHEYQTTVHGPENLMHVNHYTPNLHCL